MAVHAARRQFQDQLREIERSALGGLDMALGQVERALLALQNCDLRLAQFIVADDDRIDGRFLEVHQGVLSLLALQAPVAGDLRLCAAILHVINDVERVGDQCVNVAKLLPLSAYTPSPTDELLERVLRLGGAARDELAQARHAFAERDIELAQSLADQDIAVNRLGREVFRLAVRVGGDVELREWAMTMTLAARALERVGDNAVDIGDQAIFVVTGRYRDEPAPAERLPGA
jgi:phosphate transport system protein